MAPLLTRLALAAAAVALLSAQAPVLPMPNATPTPMAVPDKPGTKPKAKPVPNKPATRPTAKTGAKATTKTGAKPTAKPATKPGSKPGAKPKPVAKPKPGTKPKASSKPKPGAKPSPKNPSPTSTPRPNVFPATTPKPGAKFPASTPSPAKFPNTFPSYRGFGSPPPTPTPPPPKGTPGAVMVSWGGLSTHAITLKYGQKLVLRGAKGFNRTLHLFVVNPNEHFTQTNTTSFAYFPNKLTHQQKLAWLGDAGAFKHLHWAIARGPALDIDPESFLSLYDRISGNGTGYLWPMRFLFYVAVVPPAGGEVYYKLAVTITR